jgi:predicted TIM-barrel fold metal-dependent hydrolase
MTQLDARPIDADNHYYEPLDAFTRHQEPAMKRRGVQILRDGKRAYVVIGDKLNRFIPNPTFDPVIVPGCMDLHFRAAVPKGVDVATLMKVEPIHDEYRDREARLDVMDEQGLGAVIMFPTLACGVEDALRDDPEAACASLSAFNRWLEDDWGFCYQNRIISVPMLSLADPQLAEKELKSLLERGAKVIHIRPAPVPHADGPRSLGHAEHDRIWSMLTEADIPVAFHLGDSGYTRYGAAWGGNEKFEPFTGTRAADPLESILVDDRAIYDTMACMIAHGVFYRHPKLRVASIENGSEWAPILAKRLTKKANQMPKSFPEDPRDVMHRNIWVAPYYEDDIKALSDAIGFDKILFGSDWPHGEGLAVPTDFANDLKGFSEEQVNKVMRSNIIDFLGFDPRN